MPISTLPTELLNRIMGFLLERQDLLSFRLIDRSCHDCLEHYREYARPLRRCRNWLDADALRVGMRKRLGRVSKDITEARKIYDRITEDQTATEDEKEARIMSVAEVLLRYAGEQHVTTYLTRVFERDSRLLENGGRYLSKQDLRWLRRLLALCIRARIQEGNSPLPIVILPFADWISHDIGTWGDERFSEDIGDAYTAICEVRTIVGDEGFMTFFKAYLKAHLKEDTDLEWVSLLIQPLHHKDTNAMDDLKMAARLTWEVTQAWRSRADDISEYSKWADWHLSILREQASDEPHIRERIVHISEAVKFSEVTLTTLRQDLGSDGHVDEKRLAAIAFWEESLGHARGHMSRLTET